MPSPRVTVVSVPPMTALLDHRTGRGLYPDHGMKLVLVAHLLSSNAAPASAEVVVHAFSVKSENSFDLIPRPLSSTVR